MQAVEDPCYDVYGLVRPVVLCKLLKTPVMMSMVLYNQWSCESVEDPCYDVYCVVQPVVLCKLLKTPVMMSMALYNQ